MKSSSSFFSSTLLRYVCIATIATWSTTLLASDDERDAFGQPPPTVRKLGIPVQQTPGYVSPPPVGSQHSSSRSSSERNVSPQPRVDPTGPQQRLPFDALALPPSGFQPPSRPSSATLSSGGSAIRREGLNVLWRSLSEHGVVDENYDWHPLLRKLSTLDQVRDNAFWVVLAGIMFIYERDKPTVGTSGWTFSQCDGSIQSILDRYVTFEASVCAFFGRSKLVSPIEDSHKIKLRGVWYANVNGARNGWELGILADEFSRLKNIMSPNRKEAEGSPELRGRSPDMSCGSFPDASSSEQAGALVTILLNLIEGKQKLLAASHAAHDMAARVNSDSPMHPRQDTEEGIEDDTGGGLRQLEPTGGGLREDDTGGGLGQMPKARVPDTGGGLSHQDTGGGLSKQKKVDPLDTGGGLRREPSNDGGEAEATAAS